MGEKKTFTTSAVTCPWYVRTFGALMQRRIGHSFKMYDPDDLLCEAGIFIFDHFVSFEIANRGRAPAASNHSISQQTLREWRPLLAAERDQLPARSAVSLLHWPVSEGMA
ncbi:MAG: hypothetical protein EPN75_14330 [Beijerinckiaceae bacterium]|nr:MAG: hypothetical protein EPN75_14330 [Beijerinckiaceae bacterium]